MKTATAGFHASHTQLGKVERKIALSQKRASDRASADADRKRGRGRITRPDQAWAAAHREAIERGRVTDINQARAEAHIEAIERGRIQDPHVAHVDALHNLGGTAVALREVPKASNMPTIAEKPGPTHTLAVPLKFVSSALLATAKHDIRYYLNGVYIHSQDGELRVCGTDGHRMIVSRFTLPEGTEVPAWAAAGVIIPRSDLQQILPILEKNTTQDKHILGDAAMLIDFGVNHATMRLRSANGFASFQVTPIDGKFPDYAKVLAGNASTLARDGMEAMRAAAINTAYIKGAADIAAKLGAKSIRSFVGSDEKASAFFTFDGCPDTVLIVMPMASGEAVADGVVKLLGKDGIRASLAAFKAHMTRTVKAIGTTKDKGERTKLEERKSSLEANIARLLNITGASNQLTHKAA